MTWRSTSDMTRDELKDEVQQLRAAVERLIVAAVPATGPVTEPADHNTSVDEDRTYIEDKLSLVRNVTADGEDGGIDSPMTEEAIAAISQRLGSPHDDGDDLKLADRISFREIDTGGHGRLFEILVDDAPAGHSMRFSGPPSAAEMRLYAAQRLRQLGLAPTEPQLGREALQRFLSDLARLGVRHGVELVPDAQLGGIRLALLSELQGGYLAERVDDGHRVLSSYGHGVAFDNPTDDIVGDDCHPEAREERTRLWKEENAGAISERNALHHLLEIRREGPFVSMKEGRRQTQEMIAGKRRERGLEEE